MSPRKPPRKPAPKSPRRPRRKAPGKAVVEREEPQLRRRAEAALRERAPSKHASRLVHELEVHQVELEIQNEELRGARRVTESALERYTEVFDFAPIGYVTLDADGLITELNHAGAQLLGRERGRMFGRRFSSLVAPTSQPAVERLILTALVQATPAGCEAEIDHGLQRVSVRMTAAALRRGEPRVMLALQDISEQKSKELALAQTEHALRELNYRKDEFLAMLSHELRNPLSPIRTSVDVLRLAEAGSTAAASAIDIIDRSATQLTRLVEDLLDVTRITRGKIQLRRETLELVELVRKTVEEHRPALAQRRLVVETRLPDVRLMMIGDRARLVQVLSNVIGNAEKFTPAGGKVFVSVDHVTDTAVIEVRDTGVGIAPEVIAGLFEPFSQAPQSLARNPGGLGLGLTTVKALVELHGGHVAVRSAGLGRGTEVVITFAVHGDRSVIADPVLAHPPRVHRRILIVEDMRDNADSLRQALVLRGHDVEVAYDGKTGLELLLKLKPDVVLCDLGLPDIDGFTFATHARMHTDPSTVLVAISGYARPEDVARAKAAGFDHHIAKPASLDEVERLVSQGFTPEPHANSTLH